MEWNIEYLDSAESWLNKLDKQKLISLAKELRLLELCGHKLKLPHSKALGSGLFELRERKFGLRAYYCFAENMIILLCGGDKTSQKKDIKKAQRLLKQHKEGV